MALTVKETKAGARPSSGYMTTVATVNSHPLAVDNTDLYHPTTSGLGMRSVGQARGGKRAKISQPKFNLMKNRNRTIL